jgi:multicomponent Na+:H+ antiporter subunit D
VPVLFIAIPLLGVIILNLAGKKTGSSLAMWIGMLVSLIQMVISLTAGALLWKNLAQAINIDFLVNLQLDYFSLVVLFTIGLICAISLIVGNYTTGAQKFNFVNLILLIILGMNGVVMVSDLFSLYVFLEITGVASFILIALFKDRDGLEGAFKYLVMSAVATVFMLTAIACVFMSVGQLGYQEVNSFLVFTQGNYPFQLVIALVLFTAGLSIKAGLVPFHGWVPDAYSSAPNPVSVLLGGIVTKVAGVYTLMRLAITVFNNIEPVAYSLMVLGIVSIIVGALAAIGQGDFKRMLAYSSISQLGYIVLGVAAGTPLGIIGAVLHFFNHATFKSCLFINSTAVEMQTGTRELNKLGGLAARMPVTGVSSVLSFLSTAGIPPLSGFWSKVLIIVAVWQAGFHGMAAVALMASILTLAYFLILQRKVFFGKVAQGLEKVTECKKGIAWSAVILSVITVGMGVLFPFVLLFMQARGLI